jgi:hypothetical protein
MDNILFYKKLKSLSSGCRTFDDAIFICNNNNLNKLEKELVNSIIHSMKFYNVLDIKSMLKYINIMNNYKYKEDCFDLLDNIIKKTNDPAQIKTFQRIANIKPFKPQYITINDIKNKHLLIEKHCPHCNHLCSGSDDTSYIICGYTQNGYDWEGCGKDWCFNCNKILCKSWENDKLYLPINRIHDDTCCNLHAKNNNKQYIEDYCQCSINKINIL